MRRSTAIALLLISFGCFGFYYLNGSAVNNAFNSDKTSANEKAVNSEGSLSVVGSVQKSQAKNIDKTSVNAKPEGKKMEIEQKLEKLSEVSQIEPSFVKVYRGTQLQYDQLMKTGTHTKETLEFYQKFLDTLQDTGRGVKAYKEALAKNLKQEEIDSLIKMNSHPLVEKYNSLNAQDVSGNSEYVQFSKSYSAHTNPVRTLLITQFYEKLGNEEHMFQMTKATFASMAQLLNKPEMSDEKLLRSVTDSISSAGVIEMTFKLRDFSDQELSELINLKTQAPALKEEKIKQHIFEQMMSIGETGN